jgi:GTP-binding protein Era
MTESTKCGFIAIVGRPNVGKSTLLNAILDQKLSITSRKAQTTRHRILGVKNAGAVQAVYVDTPGFHQQEKHALNRYMNRAVLQALRDVDVILLVVDATSWQPDDDLILEKLKGARVPVILVLNKIDRVKDKERLLPIIASLNQRYQFKAIIPISAEKGQHLDTLEAAVENLLPFGVHLYPEGQCTDRSPRFLAAELVREKLLRLLGQEVPHNLTVTIEEFVDQEDLIKVGALIIIERASQKPIVVGKNGEKLKRVGTLAREDMERLWNKKVFLKLWVKVKTGWSDDKETLRSLGYE